MVRLYFYLTHAWSRKAVFKCAFGEAYMFVVCPIRPHFGSFQFTKPFQIKI